MTAEERWEKTKAWLKKRIGEYRGAAATAKSYGGTGYLADARAAAYQRTLDMMDELETKK